VRLGCIDYINILPVTAYLDLPQELAPPSTLNARLAEGSLDASPISSIEYARHQEEYLLLPDLSISSRGAVRSVMLFSRLPLSELDGQMVGICKATATSRVLLRILLEDFVGVHPLWRDIDEDDRSQLPALLLIGDEALQFRQGAPGAGSSGFQKNPHGYREYDLGGLWVERTGLPMVFAVWALRRESIRAAGPLVRALHASRRRGQSLPDELLERAAERTGMSREALRAYYDGLHYSLGPAEEEALLTFYRHASLKGLCPPCERLEFAASPQPPATCQAACVQEENR
jgi:chorismate dehydratase